MVKPNKHSIIGLIKGVEYKNWTPFEPFSSPIAVKREMAI